MGVKIIRRAAVYAAALAAGSAISAGTARAAETVYIGPAGGDWNVDANWQNAGADDDYGTADDVLVQPGTGDTAIILDGSTVNLNSAENVLELQVSAPQHAGNTAAAPGVARLNVGPGAALTTSGNSSGIRVGRQLDAGQAVGTSRGEIIQTGGSVNIAQGANGLRLSQADSGNIADSYYEISGGSVGAQGVTGAIVADMRLGAIGNTWGTAEFHVVGSAPTGINFLDLQMAGSTAGTGSSTLHFSIDAGGVTPINVHDELQFRSNGTGFGQNLLDIGLIGEAPAADIRLINADRLNTNGITNDPLLERFTGMPEGTPIVRQFGGFEYTWLLDYNDGGDNSVLDGFVELDFVSKTIVPEPAGLALLGMAGLALARRRRRA